MARPKKKPEYNSEEVSQQVIEAITDAYLNPSEGTADEDGKMYINLLAEEYSCLPLNVSENTICELNERLALIYTGQRRLARNLLREVVGKYIGNDETSVSVHYDIQRLAVLMRFELEKDNIDGFARLLNEHWELSKKLDSGCTNTCIDQIRYSIEDLTEGQMICGAGGGGFLQVVLKKGVTKEELRKRLRTVFQDSGVAVYDCKLMGV